MKTLRLLSVSTILVFALAILVSSRVPMALADTPGGTQEGVVSPITHSFTDMPDGSRIHWIKIITTADNTFVYPQGADNKKPKYNANDSEPRWKDNLSHMRPGLTMYQNSPVNSAWKVGFINTDYFCRSGCIGNAGAPQGLFVRNNKKFQWTGGGNTRSALLFSAADGHASIQVFSGGGTDQSSISGWRHAVSGGPIVL